MSNPRKDCSTFEDGKLYPGTNPFSFDRRGRLYIRDGQVQRQLAPDLYRLFCRIERDGTLDTLFDAGLIRTWRAESDGEHTVVHERLPFVTYPQEWTTYMLKVSALCVLDTAIVLNEAGLNLQDPHPWNVTFHHGHPVFYDFSSIHEGKQLHPRFVNDIFKGFYVSIWLRSQSKMPRHFQQLSRAVQNSEHEWRIWKQPRTEWRRLFDRDLFGRLCLKFWRIVKRYQDEDDPHGLLRSLRDHIAEIEFPQLKSMFGDYKDPGGDFDQRSSFSPKAQGVLKLLDLLPPGRLLDLACNHAWFTAYASTKGHLALGLDVDENAVDSAIQRACEFKLDVAHMNVVWPTPPQGAFLMYPSAYERFQCETVLMIALQHHLVLRQHVSFDALAAMVARFGARNLIIEWQPRDDVVVNDWVNSGKVTENLEWYTVERFMGAFHKHFANVTKVPSGAGHEDFPGPTNRTMFLFQR